MVRSREGVGTARGNSVSKGSEGCWGPGSLVSSLPSHLACSYQAELCPPVSRSLDLILTAISSAGGGL